MGSLQKMFWVLVITMIVTAGFIFSTQNSQMVTVQFGTWSSATVPLALTMFVSFAVGFLLSYLSSVVQMLKLRSWEKSSRKTIANLEKEIHALRNQPLMEELSVNAKAKPQPDRSLPPSPKKFSDDYEMEELN